MRKTEFSDLRNLEVRMFYHIIYQVKKMLINRHKSQMHVNAAMCIIVR